MEFAYDLSGTSTAIMKKYQVAATNTVIGRPYLVVANAGSGIVLGTTAGVVDAIGVNVDAAGTYVTAQQSDNSDTARLTTIIINPNAVYRMLLSGGATEGTALSLATVTAASADGLTVTSTGITWNSPELDEGTIFGYSGANAGKARKITSTGSATVATLTVALPYDTVVGDTFFATPYTPTQTETLQLTTNCTQADASIAVGTGGTWVVIEQLLLDSANNGRTSSYVLAMLQDHLYSGAIT
jgi:hypothetical protein